MFKKSIALAIVLLLVQQSTAQDINLGVSDYNCPGGASICPHPEQCELYYTSYGGQPTYLWHCKADLLFDTSYNGCNWKESTYCGNRTRPDSTGPTAPQTQTTTRTTYAVWTTSKPYTCPEDGFFASDPDRCIQTFYTCLDGFPFATNCPSYGVFEPVGRKCVSPSNAACQREEPSTTERSTVKQSTTAKTTVVASWSNTTPPPITTTRAPASSTSSSGTFVCPGNNGNYADPANCSRYYVCDNGVAYSFTCPSGLVFNPDIGNCDWPSSVPGCNGKLAL